MSDAEAEFLLVGAHALAAHGHPRATGDLDIWVRPSPENADRVWRALASFGAPLKDLTASDLIDPDLVFQIGIVPTRIDILTSLTGLEFSEAWDRRATVRYGDVDVPVIGREDLIRNKRALGRRRDLADVEDLEQPT